MNMNENRGPGPEVREGDHGPDNGLPDLVPARMLNEFAYCPRLFYLEWVQGEFRDSADTMEGRYRHRRVDHEAGSVPPPDSEEDKEEIHARSIMMSAVQTGLIAKIDVLEVEGGRATPVDYKRGKAPDLAEGAWEPERVQLCAQGLILRENGYECPEGVIYYVGSKKRVTIPFDEGLVSRTRELLEALRETACDGTIPAPLMDSPKCPRCSLVSICLPDEVNHLASGQVEKEGGGVQGQRRLIPANDTALPLYVQSQGCMVCKEGDVLRIQNKGETVEEVRLLDVSHIGVFGNVQVTTQAIRELCDRGASICYFSYGGWFYGITHGMEHKNVELRRKQYAASADSALSLNLARNFIKGKILNCRTLLRRNLKEDAPDALVSLAHYAERAEAAQSLETLLGIEGNAARVYFSRFGGMLSPKEGEELRAFDFTGRNRRPPRDPVNALLSLLYTLLVKDVTVSLLSCGFDPYLGFYHQPRYGRPALALDLMEEFRPIIADSVVLWLINTGAVKAADFIGRAGAVALKAEARRAVIKSYEQRLDSEVTHPIFGYQISYRRVLEVQARLVGRFLTGEVKSYPSFCTR